MIRAGVEKLCQKYGTLFVVAAGNENASAVQGGPGGQYNSFTVGATYGANYDKVTVFSNYSLAGDLRTKPGAIAASTSRGHRSSYPPRVQGPTAKGQHRMATLAPLEWRSGDLDYGVHDLRPHAPRKVMAHPVELDQSRARNGIRHQAPVLDRHQHVVDAMYD